MNQTGIRQLVELHVIWILETDGHNIEWDSSKQYNKFLHRPLPEGVTDIEAVLYYRVPKAIQKMPTFASVKNYASKNKNEDEHNDKPPPLLSRSYSSSSDEDED